MSKEINNDELSYWVLSFETLAKDLIQSIHKASQENNVLKLEKLVEKTTNLLRALMPIIKRNYGEDKEIE